MCRNVLNTARHPGIENRPSYLPEKQRAAGDVHSRVHLADRYCGIPRASGVRLRHCSFGLPPPLFIDCIMLAQPPDIMPPDIIPCPGWCMFGDPDCMSSAAPELSASAGIPSAARLAETTATLRK